MGPVTREEHDALEHRVSVHDVRLAVHDANQTTMKEAFRDVITELQKTRWTLIAFAFVVAGSAAGAVIGLG